MEKAGRSIQSLDRAMRLLDLLSATPSGVRLVDLAQASGLHPQTAQGLLRTLEAWNVCTQGERGGLYRMGSAALRWAEAWWATRQHLERARAELESLNAVVREYVLLAEWEGDRIHRAIEIQSPQAVGVNPDYVSANSMHTMATAKILLAELEPSLQALHLSRLTFSTGGPRAIRDLGAFSAELNKVKSMGYAESMEEAAGEIVALAVPVRRPDGRTSALGLALPESRYRRRRTGLLRALRASASRIEALWANSAAAGSVA